MAPPRERAVRALNRDAVLETGLADPAWLKARREEAWDVYMATPLPSTRSEEWRYTDVARLLPLDGLEPNLEGADRVPDPLLRTMARDQTSAGRVVDIDGTVVSAELDPALAAQGVVLCSLREAARSCEPVVEALLATRAVPPSDGKFPALNAALWTDGVFLRVPKGVRLQEPVRLSRWVSRPGTATLTRILIVAEELSQVSFVDEIMSPDFESATLVNTAVELFSQRGAQVQYVSLQRMGRGGFYLASQRTLAERDSTLDTLNVALGGSVGRVDLNARLLGPGANSDMLGLYFGDDDQHFDFNTSQDHVAPDARSDLLYKGALDGSARGVFRGIIRVHKGAQRTDAYQTNRNLILSDDAVATSLPNLEIGADDVRCSHGATVGQLDAEALFYLMSRGLDRAQAERLVVLGFLGEVLKRLPLGGVTEKVTKAIEAKLRHVRA
ncbi:MAG: Fe-S cluster assembly protein SufD [Gemmatimonadetes bacterium]|nr:Fe-S cluster assembly protein SufD [Gemmatimonadota bacterium]MYD14414.1 Fe-S cluster assembly protein SufD [Gemmatimonadota bacterium]MYI66055.1 Fe-S cluster assembly protein SufD [Gemmatimonadota bacterium]